MPRKARRDGPPKIERFWIASIKIKPGRRALNPAVVERLAKSMAVIGLKTPITVRYFSHEETDGLEDRVELVTGRNRLAAAQQLGWEYIDAFMIEREIEGPDVKDADVELWEIDENLIRAELDAAEHALLTERRAEIIAEKAKAEEVISSQVGTKSKREKTAKNPNGAGRPKEAASIADQAEKTGESKSKIARSLKRAEKLGTETLRRVAGTSLGSGVELDAMAQLPPEQREELIKDAAAGKKVSAKQETHAQCKAELAGTSLDKHDELNALGTGRQRDELVAGEKVSDKVALEHASFEDRVELVWNSCTAIGELAVPPDIPRELARDLLVRVEEAQAGLYVLCKALHTVIGGDEPEEEQQVVAVAPELAEPGL